MSIIVIGIDLAKNIFAVLHGVKVSRERLLPLIVNLAPCPIGMKACSGARRSARCAHYR